MGVGFLQIFNSKSSFKGISCSCLTFPASSSIFPPSIDHAILASVSCFCPETDDPSDGWCVFSINVVILSFIVAVVSHMTNSPVPLVSTLPVLKKLLNSTSPRGLGRTQMSQVAEVNFSLKMWCHCYKQTLTHYQRERVPIHRIHELSLPFMKGHSETLSGMTWKSSGRQL
jgi:hypothetical protein